MTTPSRQILRNASRRPLELHLLDRVEILLPEAMVEFDPDQMTAAGIAPLLASGALTQFDQPVARPRKTAARKGRKTTGAAANSTSKAAARAAARIPGPAAKAATPARPATTSTIKSPEGRSKPSGDPK